mmetsp:Transcript_19298/g.65578  ORF Transcript_19298/g.65578 Transcript_19298/m.65578 type:complete len:288 (-) Transcript_19298:650-1513(-)
MEPLLVKTTMGQLRLLAMAAAWQAIISATWPVKMDLPRSMASWSDSTSGASAAPTPLSARCCSVRRATDAMTASALLGCSPCAVSPESITASVPSRTAMEMSLTSARVGVGYSIMLSSMFVATITGLPSVRHRRMMSVCSIGTSSRGISAPRSPLATMAPSAASRIAAMFWTAFTDSILGRIPALAPRASMCALTSSTTSGPLTKDSAKKSTPWSMPKLMSSQSFSVRLGSVALRPRTLRWRRLFREPPSTVRQYTSVADLPTTSRAMMPPSTSSSSPSCTSLTKPS